MAIQLLKALSIAALAGSSKIKADRVNAAVTAKAQAEQDAKLAVEAEKGIQARLTEQFKQDNLERQARLFRNEAGEQIILFPGQKLPPARVTQKYGMGVLPVPEGINPKVTDPWVLVANRRVGETNWTLAQTPQPLYRYNGRAALAEDIPPEWQIANPMVQIGVFDPIKGPEILGSDKAGVIDPVTVSTQHFFNGTPQPNELFAAKASEGYGEGGNWMVQTTETTDSGRVVSQTTKPFDGAPKQSGEMPDSVTFFDKKNGSFYTGDVDSPLTLEVMKLNGVSSIEGLSEIGGADVYSQKLVGGKVKKQRKEHVEPAAGLDTTTISYETNYRGKVETHPTIMAMNEYLKEKGTTPPLHGYFIKTTEKTGANIKKESVQYIAPAEQMKHYGMEDGKVWSHPDKSVLMSKYPDIEYLGQGKFVGDVLIKTEDKITEDRYITYTTVGDKIKSVMFSDMEEEDRKHIAENPASIISERPVKVFNKGTERELVTAAGDIATATVDDNMLLNTPFMVAGSDLNVQNTRDPVVNLSQLGGRISNDVVTAFTIPEGATDTVKTEIIKKREDFLNAFGDFIHLNALKAQGSDPATGYSRIGPPNQIFKPSIDFLKKNNSRLLDIPGMEAYLFEKSQQTLNGIVEDQQRVLQSREVDGKVIYTTAVSTQENLSVNEALQQGVDVGIVSVRMSQEMSVIVEDVVRPVMNIVHRGTDPSLIQDEILDEIIVYDPVPNVSGIGYTEVPKKVQPKLNIINSFHNSRDRRNQTLYAQFVQLTNLGADKVPLEQHKTFATSIVGSLGIEDGVRFIKAHIGRPTVQDNRMYFPPTLRAAMSDYGLGLFKDNASSDARANARVVAKSALRGRELGIKIVQSYTADDGSLLPSTAVANTGLGIEGAIYFLKDGIGEIAQIVGVTAFDSAEDRANALADNLIARASGTLSQVASDNRLTVEANATGTAELNAELRSMANEVANLQDMEGLSGAERRKIAARQFYIVTLAYEISAAIQGGTGGRTISDQDVALILKALRQGNLSTPATQKAVMEEAVNMLGDMYTHAKYASSEKPREVAAYAIWSGMAAATNVRPPQFNSLSAVESALRTNIRPTIGQANKDAILSSVNMKRRSMNEPEYPTFDDIPQSEVDAVKSVLNLPS